MICMFLAQIYNGNLGKLSFKKTVKKEDIVH